MPQKHTIPLSSGRFYHIYNRGIAKQRIFFSKENYHYFLRTLRKYINPIAEIYAYCLLGNHYHLLIKIKEEEELPEKYKCGGLSLSFPFGHAFNAYAQAINKQEKRTGSLFQKPFRRRLLLGTAEKMYTIYYIHLNPEKHGIVPDFRKYWISSYKDIISSTNPDPNRGIVLDWFGGKEGFLSYHQEVPTIPNGEVYAML